MWVPAFKGSCAVVCCRPALTLQRGAPAPLNRFLANMAHTHVAGLLCLLFLGVCSACTSFPTPQPLPAPLPLAIQEVSKKSALYCMPTARWHLCKGHQSN